MKGFLKLHTQAVLLLALLTSLGTGLGACSQSRNSLYAGQKTEEIWAPQSLCSVSIAGFNRMGCFSVQLSITRNLAYFDVQELLFNPGEVPYRILARRQGDSAFTLLVDNATVAAGGTVEVKAKAGAYIEEYQEWRVELTKGRDENGLNLITAAAGQGLPVVQDVINWSELDGTTETQPNPQTSGQ